MKCEECRFWDIEKTIGHDNEEPRGYCRRFPPVLYDRELAGDDGEEGAYGWAWPTMLALSWCGEFRPKPLDLSKFDGIDITAPSSGFPDLSR